MCRNIIIRVLEGNGDSAWMLPFLLATLDPWPYATRYFFTVRIVEAMIS